MDTELGKLLARQYALERQLEEADGRVDEGRKEELWLQLSHLEIEIELHELHSEET